jgi:polysaccharide export outer membrane protein
MRNLLILIAGAILFSSCSVNSDLMFKTSEDYEFDELADSLSTNYTISPNDILNFRLFTNGGIQILELNRNQATAARNLAFSLNYIVRPDSLVELPSIGLINLTGLTVQEAQETLADKYSQFYIDPFLQIEVTNNRVIVFPGTGGAARVINLTNNNTTIIEALALAGGVSTRGRSSKIKLIRREKNEVKVYLVDLSTIDGVQYANTIVQANDIIYVEPTAQLLREILTDVAPAVTLITNAFLIRNLIRTN